MASKQYSGGKEGMDQHDNSHLLTSSFPFTQSLWRQIAFKKKWLSPVKKVDLSKNRIDFD